MEISQLKKENAYLRKSLDELARKKGDSSDPENYTLLLERILSLETLREKNSQQLLSKDEEIASLKSQLGVSGRETVAHLQAQIEDYHKEAERRERLFQALQAETEDVKNKLVAVSTKCQDLEGRNVSTSQSSSSVGQASSSTAAVIHEHLRDALDKNQQWLAYDQQREAYVKAVLARVFGLEQQLNQTKQALLQKHNEAHSGERRSVQMQEHCDQLVLTARRELEAQREQLTSVQKELEDLQWRCEEKQSEMEDVRQQLQEERLRSKRSVQEERRRSGDREDRLRAEAEDVQARLEGERHRSAELLLQVNLLQKSLSSQHEDLQRTSVLEQQIQVSAKDLEDEKKDCQYLQKQLHVLLKELRKAKDHASRLELEKKQWESYEAGAPSRPPATKSQRDKVTSPSRPATLLDESFLECPSCRAQYPTSQHRELLAHVDNCLG